MALNAVVSRAVAPTDRHRLVGGVVIDIPSKGGCATVVALVDGTTSMYTSTGGGVVGAGSRAHVAAATHHLIDSAESQLSLFSPTTLDSLPPRGTVRFHVLGFDRTHTLDVPDDCFWGRKQHDLFPTISAAQDVITAIHSPSDHAGDE